MTVWQRLRHHWPEYLIEGWGLGMFMISAGVVATVLNSPRIIAHGPLSQPFVRGSAAGIAMGLTLLLLVYSPWGMRSGAQLNPALTVAFVRVGRMHRWDAVFFILAQTLGGLLGVLLVAGILGMAFTAPPVRYAATLPGNGGPWIAFAAEFVISAVLMGVILVFSNTPRLARFTGIAAACMVALYITFEAPLSGMSMNPARSLASALPAAHWDSFWVYLCAPVLGMLTAAQVYLLVPNAPRCGCAKLMHSQTMHCIHCGQRPSNPLSEVP